MSDTVFVHGGISPKAREGTIEKMNRQVQLEIEAFDRVREYLVAQQLILPFFTYPEISAVVDLELARPEPLPDDMLRVLRMVKSIYEWTIYSPDGRESLDAPPQASGRGIARPGSQFAFASLSGEVAARSAEAVWRGPDGGALPLRTAGEVEAFLRDTCLSEVAAYQLSRCWDWTPSRPPSRGS